MRFFVVTGMIAIVPTLDGDRIIINAEPTVSAFAQSGYGEDPLELERIVRERLMEQEPNGIIITINSVDFTEFAYEFAAKFPQQVGKLN